MRKRDLIRTIKDAAKDAGLDFELKRQGGNHEMWSLDGLTLPIPRHRDINEITAKGIMKDAANKLGKDWWT